MLIIKIVFTFMFLNHFSNCILCSHIFFYLNSFDAYARMRFNKIVRESSFSTQKLDCSNCNLHITLTVVIRIVYRLWQWKSWKTKRSSNSTALHRMHACQRSILPFLSQSCLSFRYYVRFGRLQVEMQLSTR